MRIITFLLILIIVVIGVTFALLNHDMVTFHYYFGQATMPLSLLLVSVFATGCVLGLLVGLWLVIKAKLKNFRLKQKLKNTEKEVQNLRAIPIQDRH